MGNFCIFPAFLGPQGVTYCPKNRHIKPAALVGSFLFSPNHTLGVCYAAIVTLKFLCFEDAAPAPGAAEPGNVRYNRFCCFERGSKSGVVFYDSTSSS